MDSIIIWTSGNFWCPKIWLGWYLGREITEKKEVMIKLGKNLVHKVLNKILDGQFEKKTPLQRMPYLYKRPLYFNCLLKFSLYVIKLIVLSPTGETNRCSLLYWDKSGVDEEAIIDMILSPWDWRIKPRDPLLMPIPLWLLPLSSWNAKSLIQSVWEIKNSHVGL